MPHPSVLSFVIALSCLLPECVINSALLMWCVREKIKTVAPASAMSSLKTTTSMAMASTLRHGWNLWRSLVESASRRSFIKAWAIGSTLAFKMAATLLGDDLRIHGRIGRFHKARRRMCPLYVAGLLPERL